MKAILPVLLLLAAAPAAFAQDDYELANGLTERGWFDLAGELFGRIKNNTGLSAEARAEGNYGLARIKIKEAQREENTDKKNALFKKAIEEVEGFLKEFPKHRRMGEALSDIADLHQSQGKALVLASKADPSKMEEAEKAFGAAEKRFSDLIAALKKDPKKPVEDPKKDPAGQAAYEEWEEKIMFAKYNFAAALFSHAETFKDIPSKHPDMRRLLEQMNKFLNEDFMWEYERYLMAFDAFIYMGRAYQILAEAADREKAEDHWKNCFVYASKPRSLMTDPDARKNETAREIAMRGIMHEMKARMSYGDFKRGQAGQKQFGEAVRMADDFFKQFPGSRTEPMGKALRLEQARALCKSGDITKGMKLLEELKREGKDSWVEDLAIDILGEYGGEANVQLAVEAGDNLFERGPAFYYRAMQKYRKALLVAKKPEDQKHVGYCWYMLGRCYFALGRHYEAVQALSMLERGTLASSKDAGDAALRKLGSLQAIARATKDKADEKAFEEYRSWFADKFKALAGAAVIRQDAVEADEKGDFAKAAERWDQLAKPGTEIYEEAAFSLGHSLYRLGLALFEQGRAAKAPADKDKFANQGLDAWKRAEKAFKGHIDHVEKLPSKEPKTAKRALGSILFYGRILTSERFGKPADALSVSNDIEKRFPGGEPQLVIGIMSLRIDAKLKAKQVQEAEEDLKVLKAKYEKENQGLGHYTNALVRMAGAFETAANAERGKPEIYDLYAMKAATYYYEYYTLNPDAVRGKGGQAEAMAEKLFMAAEQRMAMGEAKIGKEGIKEAREIYAKCLDIYQGYLIEEQSKLPKDQVRAIGRRITRCLLMTGKFEEAIKSYEDNLKLDVTTKKDGNSWEELADCYLEKARNLPKGGERTKYLQEADKIYAELATRLMGSQTVNDHTWRLLYKHAETAFEADPEAGRLFFDTMDLKGYGRVKDVPRWDVDASNVSQWGWAPKFEELRKRVDAVLPPRKS